jgi:hypothetical protein
MSRTTKTAPINPIAVAAAQEFIGRKNRSRHPDGRSDKAGRWYPSDAEDPKGTVARTIRSPSRAWPWSYAHACRTAAHVAELFGVDVSAVRRMARELEKPSYPIIAVEGV